VARGAEDRERRRALPPAYVERLLTEPMSDALLTWVVQEPLQEENFEKTKEAGAAANARRHLDDESLLPVYLSQSLCHERSRFRNVNGAATTNTTTATETDTASSHVAELAKYSNAANYIEAAVHHR
jgi:hypothetical protein